MANILFCLLICLSVFDVNGQERKDLETRRSQTKEEIEYTNQLLEETQKSRKNTLQRVRILNRRIQLRNNIIESINLEIAMIDNEIEQKNGLIRGMEEDLEKIREQYEDMILQAYRNREKIDWLMFLMSAENFNQAYRRMKYLQQFSAHRREQAELIEKMRADIVTEILSLEEKKAQKETLALEKRNENINLESEKRGKSRMVADLAKKEDELKEEIREKRRIADKLEKEIAAIIAEEARKSRSRNMYDQLTPEEKLISDNFQGNKGMLPWPVERGVITGKYGVHPHPVLKQVSIDNDGVDISTVKGAEARAVFDGEVSKIVSILGTNFTVILRHGNFLTVYQNLVNLKVKQGDKVKHKQVLGTVHTDIETSITMLHMQIWRERKIEDPEAWISRK